MIQESSEMTLPIDVAALSEPEAQAAAEVIRLGSSDSVSGCSNSKGSSPLKSPHDTPLPFPRHSGTSSRWKLLESRQAMSFSTDTMGH